MNHVEPNLSVQFSAPELMTLEALRARYEDTGDRFTGPELARLNFLRWLVSQGGLGSQPEANPGEPRPQGHLARSADAASESDDRE